MSDELEIMFKNIEDKFKSVWHEINESKVERTELFKRVGCLEVDTGSIKADVKNLCKSVDSLINTIKWGLGIFVTVSICVIGFLSK